MRSSRPRSASGPHLARPDLSIWTNQQRGRAPADTDRMLPVRAFLILPTVIVVEVGRFDLHVMHGDAIWCVRATGRRVRRASWGRC